MRFAFPPYACCYHVAQAKGLQSVLVGVKLAKPRIFISSTFYDLRYARVSLEGFIREMGYDPVLNERGSIPYGNEKSLQDYCYNEINKVSIVVSIIGGRFGSQSNVDTAESISNTELRTAIELGKQVYVFVENTVLAEYNTYTKNIGTKIGLYHADDIRVHEFIDKIFKLPRNNQIFGFNEVPQIISYLKEQWAGLFEGFLDQKGQESLSSSIDKVEATAQTLRGLIELVQKAPQSENPASLINDAAIKGILIQDHPIFGSIRRMLSVPYRLFFTNKLEFTEWLRGARGGKEIKDDLPFDENYYEFSYKGKQAIQYILLSKELFDETENLKLMRKSEWNEEMLKLIPVKSGDEDIPF